MLKGLWLCVKRFPKPELVIFACVAVLIYTFGNAVDNYVKDKAVEVYERTLSISNESLEIVLCPMPRVYGLRLAQFGESLSKFFNKLLFHEVFTPLVAEVEAKLRKQHHLIMQDMMRDGYMKCVLNQRKYKPSDGLKFLLRRMKLDIFSRTCKIRNDRYVALSSILKNETTIARFLDKHFGTLDEMLLEEYPGLLDQVWVLPYDNLTIEQMLDYVGVNLTRYIDEDMLRSSVQDIAGPSQTLEESLIDTRMAPNCFRHLFRHDESRGYQRSKIVYQFRKNCTDVWTDTGKSPCPEMADMYITMYITAYNQFTDVPAASVIVPYRVAADENTLLHVSAVKRIHKRHCKTYGQEESQVTCIEDCLYEKMTSKNQTEDEHEEHKVGKVRCNVPWIKRLKRRSNRMVELPLCHTKEELSSTIQTIRKTFDMTEASECSRRCPRHCDQLTITPRLAGSARSPQADSVTRIPRHPRLEVLISDSVTVFSEMQQYDFGKMVAEMLGNLSFLVGVSLVALYDWLIGLVLWMFGKLPFIPSMPPLIKNEIYVSEICSCAETEEERRQSIRHATGESDTVLAASFRHHRRASVLKSFTPLDEHRHRRRAMTLNQLPAIAVKSSAMDTIAMTFYHEERSAERVQSRYGSVDRSRSLVKDEGSSETLSGGKESIPERNPDTDLITVRSQGSVPLSRRKTSISTQPVTVEKERALPKIVAKPTVDAAHIKANAAQPTTAVARPSTTVAVSAAGPSRAALKKSSSRRVAPEEVAKAPAEHSRRTTELPSIAAADRAGPRQAVTFDLQDLDVVLDSPTAGRGEEDEETRPERRDHPAGPQYRNRPLRKQRPARAGDSASPGRDQPPED